MQSTLEDRPTAVALRIWFLTSMFLGIAAFVLSFIAAAGFFPLALLVPAVALVVGLPALFILIPILRWIQSLKVTKYQKIYLLRFLCVPVAILYGIACVCYFPDLPRNMVHLVGVGANAVLCLFIQLSLSISRHLLHQYFTDSMASSSKSPESNAKDGSCAEKNDSLNHIDFS